MFCCLIASTQLPTFVGFCLSGLHDYSPFLALHTVLDFWENIGRDTMLEYMHTLCREAGKSAQTFDKQATPYWIKS